MIPLFKYFIRKLPVFLDYDKKYFYICLISENY